MSFVPQTEKDLNGSFTDALRGIASFVLLVPGIGVLCLALLFSTRRAGNGEPYDCFYYLNYSNGDCNGWGNLSDIPTRSYSVTLMLGVFLLSFPVLVCMRRFSLRNLMLSVLAVGFAGAMPYVLKSAGLDRWGRTNSAQ